MQALGLIEVKGLIPAIESADVMVKSSNVSILEKNYVGGGLVSIIITGDVGAVKSAIDAGVSAINRLGENFLVSNHVIARPHEDLEKIMEFEPKIEKNSLDNEKESKIDSSIEVILDDKRDENKENELVKDEIIEEKQSKVTKRKRVKKNKDGDKENS